MKAKLMALILAVGLGITGIAIPTQAMATNAAETNAAAACQHKNLELNEGFVKATYYDGKQHLSTYTRTYICMNCYYIIDAGEEIRFEEHDYEQIYFQDGSVMSVCLGCHDSYLW